MTAPPFVHPRSVAGFTLIETIIAIALTGIVAWAIVLPLATSLQSSHSPVLTQQALALVQERIEQILADRHDRTTILPVPKGFEYATTPASYPPEAPVAGFADFSRTVLIECVDATLAVVGAPNPSCALRNGRNDLARVTVTVSHLVIGDVAGVTLLTNY